jgi:hypothetical protein
LAASLHREGIKTVVLVASLRSEGIKTVVLVASLHCEGIKTVVLAASLHREGIKSVVMKVSRRFGFPAGTSGKESGLYFLCAAEIRIPSPATILLLA